LPLLRSLADELKNPAFDRRAVKAGGTGERLSAADDDTSARAMQRLTQLVYRPPSLPQPWPRVGGATPVWKICGLPPLAIPAGMIVAIVGDIDAAKAWNLWRSTWATYRRERSSFRARAHGRAQHAKR
jgi:predicted Zn-dependent peptidase